MAQKKTRNRRQPRPKVGDDWMIDTFAGVQVRATIVECVDTDQPGESVKGYWMIVCDEGRKLLKEAGVYDDLKAPAERSWTYDWHMIKRLKKRTA